jgi:16S rRNA pseudouridine516 synthase
VLTGEDRDAFRAGMTLGDGLTCLPAELRILEGGTAALVTLREGKYHQIKRMMAARGKPVTGLRRLTMGALILDPGLEPGGYRDLTQGEIRAVCGVPDAEDGSNSAF